MGIIIKQSIKGSIWSYLGVAVGFVTTAYLFPNYLSTDTVGLFGLLLSWSLLFAQFSSLGFHGVTARLFPYFRSKENGHNGFLFIALMVMVCGFSLFLVTFYLLKPWLIESNLEKSQLFVDYVDLLIPLTFFSLIFNFLDTFNKLLYDVVFGIFITEFFQRVLILVVVILFIFGWISFNNLILYYAGAVSIKGLIIFFYLLIKGEINFRPQLQFIDRKLKREIIDVALFSILAGIGSSIIFRIDKIIVNQMLGLDATGIYTIAFYFGTLVVLPSRTLLNISGTLIADAWKRNDVEYIKEIYKKSCINQFIIAMFLFGGIWVNIDNILVIIGPEYAEGKWVIFFIGLGYLIDMATGANGQIIAFSKYYRMGLWFLVVLVLLVLISMYFFIPIWGITGAAIAIAISFFLNNLMRYFFLNVKYNMQPFNYRFVIVIFAFLLAYLVQVFLPKMPLFWDVLITSSVFASVFIILIATLQVSDDVSKILINLLKSIRKIT